MLGFLGLFGLGCEGSPGFGVAPWDDI